MISITNLPENNMKRSDIQTVPEFYKKYINLVEDIDLMDALKGGGIDLYEAHFDQIKALGEEVYAPGKWTMNQMIEHLMDTERIFLNRALRFARNDKTELPGYEENFYADNARSNDIPIEKLLTQYKNLRQVTIDTFSNFNDEELMRTGKANGAEISVLALGFIQVGHPIHHFNVIKERYFPLITQ